jgi:selenocysteine-specific elongation factor
VATGIFVAGELDEGEEIEALFFGRRAWVRGFQVHGEAVDRVSAGICAAVNLAGDV